MAHDEFYFKSLDQVIRRWNDEMWRAKGKPKLWVEIYNREGITVWRDVGHGWVRLSTPEGVNEGKDQASVGNIAAVYANGAVEIRKSRPRSIYETLDLTEEVVMEASKPRRSRTEEILVRRIALTRVNPEENEQSQPLTGWEMAPPKMGERYVLNLDGGMLFRTSPVKEIDDLEDARLIRTGNSTYRVEYRKI
jgi:hypothetical protein